MKEPRPRGTAIDMGRISSWMSDFASYRHSVTEGRIERWLRQFASDDQDLAARVLDCIDFVSREQMAAAFRSFLASLDGWHRDEDQRQGQWRFVAFSASAGESGDEMLHLFRLANMLNGRQYNHLFIYKSELLSENLGPNDTVVFIDDFSGTGTQVCNTWPEIQELLPGGPKVFLVLVAAGVGACERIEEQTEIILVPSIRLLEQDNIFSPSCKHFTTDEQYKLLSYCQRANNRFPRGYGDCSFVIVLAHTCPNNSIPILHVYHSEWEGLFRRYD